MTYYSGSQAKRLLQVTDMDPGHRIHPPANIGCDFTAMAGAKHFIVSFGLLRPEPCPLQRVINIAHLQRATSLLEDHASSPTVFLRG